MTPLGTSTPLPIGRSNKRRGARGSSYLIGDINSSSAAATNRDKIWGQTKPVHQTDYSVIHVAVIPELFWLQTLMKNFQAPLG